MWDKFEASIKERVLVIDGAMGTSLQRFKLTEEDYRGERFADWHTLVKGNNDLLNLTQPDKVKAVHEAYFAAGSDLIETNTFNATTISQADYEMSDLAAEIAGAGAKLARAAADEWTAKTPDKPRGVMGAVGPLNVTLSISPKVEDPGYRAVTFDQVEAAYVQQMRAMWPYVDAILIETVFDTLNAKAAIAASRIVADELGEKPLMISGTITDRSGRTLSGQTAEAFWLSVAHAKPFAIGLNCALGAEELRPYVAELARVASSYVLAYPNAGLPNAFGEYDETPDETAAFIRQWAKDGLVNMVGGCCGTTPEHIAAIAKAVEGVSPRQRADYKPGLYLSGLEPFRLSA